MRSGVWCAQWCLLLSPLVDINDLSAFFCTSRPRPGQQRATKEPGSILFTCLSVTCPERLPTLLLHNNGAYKTFFVF